MRGYICRCSQCGNYTVTTERIKKEIMDCGCGGVLAAERECSIGVDLALSCCNDMTTIAPVCIAEEGIAATDAFPRIGKDDTLILQSARIFGRKETMTEIQEEIKERTGMNVALFDGKMKIIGVVKNGFAE